MLLSFFVSMRNLQLLLNDICTAEILRIIVEYVQGYVCTEGDSKFVQIKVATAIE